MHCTYNCDDCLSDSVRILYLNIPPVSYDKGIGIWISHVSVPLLNFIRKCIRPEYYF